MKKMLTLTLAVAIGCVQLNNAFAKGPKKVHKQQMVQVAGTLAIADTVHNFGKIPAGTPVGTTFKFTNTSRKIMVIENVSTSCGCTTPEWDKHPVLPGKTTDVHVGYNAAAPGSFYKTITVKFSGGQKTIYIQGEVTSNPS